MDSCQGLSPQKCLSSKFWWVEILHLIWLLRVRSNHISMKSKHPLESNGRKAPTSGKIDSKSMGTRKQLDRNESGSGRPLGSNGLPLKMSASTTERKTSDDEHDPEAGNVRDVIRKMFR
ncbi:unnamed protein product [Malus baccata var. baccata]